AALFTIPVADTALYISDQYVTSRSIVTFAVLLAVWNAWKRRPVAWFLWSALAVSVHPLMGVFGISYSLLLWRARQWRALRPLHLAGGLGVVCSLSFTAVFSL